MTGVLNDFPCAFAYLYDIIIFSRTAEEHLHHIIQVFLEITDCTLIHETQQMSFLCQGDPAPWMHPQHHRHQTTTMEDPSYQQHAPTKIAKQVHAFLGLVRYHRKFIKHFRKMVKPLTLLTCHKAKFEWTPTHHMAFMMLKETIIETPILCYPDPARRYIVYMGASDDVCRAQLTQEHDATEFPIPFLSQTFTETQRKWST